MVGVGWAFADLMAMTGREFAFWLDQQEQWSERQREAQEAASRS